MAQDARELRTLYTKMMENERKEVGVLTPIVRIGNELFLLGYGGVKYDFSGTPTTYHGNGDVVGAAPCLRDWQADPGLYVRGTGHYILGSMVGGDGTVAIVGGSFNYVTSYMHDHNLTRGPDWRCFDDRNVVRALAVERGGTEW